MITATRRPPNAGFRASSRPSSTARPTASPVRPAPRVADTRAATSRPHAVPGTRMAHGRAALAHRATPAATSSSTSAPWMATTVSAPQVPWTAGSGTPGPIATTRAGSRPARRAAAPSSSLVMRSRSGSTTTAIGGSLAPDGGSTGSTRSTSTGGSSTPRSASTATSRSTCASTGPSTISPIRSTSRVRTSPTFVGLASTPQGPAPRSAAVIVRMRSAATAARASGGCLAGSMRRSAQESTAGRVTVASTHSSSCSSRTSTWPSPRVSSRTPVANGRSRSWASWGPTCPVSASTELRPTRTRSNAPSRSSTAASALAVASVSEPAKAGSVTNTPSTSRPDWAPQAMASRRQSSADGGPRVSTVTEPAVVPASSQPSDTARRQ